MDATKRETTQKVLACNERQAILSESPASKRRTDASLLASNIAGGHAWRGKQPAPLLASASPQPAKHAGKTRRGRLPRRKAWSQAMCTQVSLGHQCSPPAGELAKEPPGPCACQTACSASSITSAANHVLLLVLVCYYYRPLRR